MHDAVGFSVDRLVQEYIKLKWELTATVLGRSTPSFPAVDPPSSVPMTATCTSLPEAIKAFARVALACVNCRKKRWGSALRACTTIFLELARPTSAAILHPNVEPGDVLVESNAMSYLYSPKGCRCSLGALFIRFPGINCRLDVAEQNPNPNI